MATLTFTLALEKLEIATLVVREFQGYNSISESSLPDASFCYGFRYQLALASHCH